MKRVFLASPYTSPTVEGIARHVRYARAATADSFSRGEAPYTGHLQNTQPGVLRDEVPEEREQGIGAGLFYLRSSELMVVYRDLGISDGMKDEIKLATELGITIEYRELGAAWEETLGHGIYPDEVVVALDQSGGIGEVMASSAYFHIERMDNGWFWFALSDQDFSVRGGEDGSVEISHGGDSSATWDPDEREFDPEHVVIFDVPGDGTASHKARPCPNIDCEHPLDLHIERDGDEFAQVRCGGCGVSGPRLYEDASAAVLGWNALPRRVHWLRRKGSK